MNPKIDWQYVKCPKDKGGCGKITRTRSKEDFQCPHDAGGCGRRFPVKECLIKV